MAALTYVPRLTVPTVSEPLPDPERCGVHLSDVSPLDYVVEERLLSGSAPIYAPIHEADFTIAEAPPGMVPDSQGGELGGPASGAPWDIPGMPSYDPDDTQDRPILGYGRYTTRLVLYRPSNMNLFSGTVVVETIHPSRGGHTTMWGSVNEFLAARGDVVIGVQHPRTFGYLKHHRPGRYDAVECEDFSLLWGMLADTARVMRSAPAVSPLGIGARRVYLTGYSFTGLIVTTFAQHHHRVNAAAADGSPVFDGYVAGTGFGTMPELDVPVLAAANEQAAYNDSDVSELSTLSRSASRPAREAFDADGPLTRRRRYEVVGFAHVPTPVREPGSAIPASGTAQVDLPVIPAGAEPNPNEFGRALYEGMFRNLTNWVEHGVAPPRAPLIETANGRPIRDGHGNAAGGVRMPEIEIPTATYVIGSGPQSKIGWRVPFTPELLRTLYRTPGQYLARFGEAADALVAGRFITEDRGTRMKAAAADRVPISDGQLTSLNCV